MTGTKFETTFTLKRQCEAGNSVDTKIQFMTGTPMAMVITQGTNRVEITAPEANVFNYVMREFRVYKNLVNEMNNPDEDDD